MLLFSEKKRFSICFRHPYCLLHPCEAALRPQPGSHTVLCLKTNFVNRAGKKERTLRKTSLAAAALAATLALGATGASAQPTLYVGSYGGSTQTAFEKTIIPQFEKAHDVKIVYVPGNSTDTLAKLQAQKGKEELNVVLLDDGPMYQAVQFGFCDKLADAPVYHDLYPLAHMSDRSVALGVVATGLAYNADAFKKAGLPPPDSWSALTDKRFKQKIAIPPISNTYGLQTLVMFARMNGGGESNIAPGFDALIKKVAPNVLAWEPSPGKMTELFQNGDVTLAVWGSGRTYTLEQTGFPIRFVYPKEGAMALLTATCPVVENKEPQLSQQFVQYLLSPEVQTVLAKTQAWGPVNSKTKLDPAVAATVPYGNDQIGKLVKTDWTIVNEKRTQWTNEWNRQVER
ncbi:branched-chain amino acid ABC transporter substrate-binding protein [Trinickia symbiotica]|uniref:Branched-chain amino acid ABC transporter substrate-binding protein n=1 Tax=Trinickia symbiotica TaxID=863227 RepID=A0A2N7X113_9BURK|nr:branched-chain amino acid ABC transporter substrate-binding protein [Trinickia symbiotica]